MSLIWESHIENSMVLPAAAPEEPRYDAERERRGRLRGNLGELMRAMDTARENLGAICEDLEYQAEWTQAHKALRCLRRSDRLVTELALVLGRKL